MYGKIFRGNIKKTRHKKMKYGRYKVLNEKNLIIIWLIKKLHRNLVMTPELNIIIVISKHPLPAMLSIGVYCEFCKITLQY